MQNSIQWEELLGQHWAQIIMPTVCPIGQQFIGFLLPTGEMKLGEIRQAARQFAGDPQVEVMAVTKPLGKDLVPCLSVVHHFGQRVYLSQRDLTRAAENLQGQVRLAFGVPAVIRRVISSRVALRLLM